MRYLEDPKQNQLFDRFEEILSAVAYKKLRHDWQALFRSAIRGLMPTDKLAEHFDPRMGRPTKELYSIAGLLFIMEFRNWTHEEAVDAYMFNVDIQFALNLVPDNQSLCRRTLARYIRLFREDELAQQVMVDVSNELIQRLELDVSKQRLGSTHLHSNMARFGRIKLMATAIAPFLTQSGNRTGRRGHTSRRGKACPPRTLDVARYGPEALSYKENGECFSKS